jgi:cysteine desulfurase/selenocysteine lyase
MSGKSQAFDVAKVRQDFPALGTLARGKPLVYLDNAATTLKAKPVVDAVARYYLLGSGSVHRGVHYLSEEATRTFEATREKARAFLNAKEAAEVIFTPGTTAGINLVAHSYGSLLKAGDEIIVTEMEHHSNIVPWQMLSERQGTVLKVVPITDEGELRLDELERLIGPRTRLIAVTAVSNALGTVNPLARIAALARAHAVPVLVDAAQAGAHLSLDVQALGIDFLALSSHKIFGPTGVGLLYGRRALLEKMPPFLGGGGMIRSVTFEKTTYADLPERFEAGTPDIGGVIGLGAALEYVSSIGLEKIHAYEAELLAYGTKALASVEGLRLIGTASDKASILSFVLDGVHPHDIGQILDQDGVAVRAGHHCAQPIMRRFGVPATARASLAMYNTKADIDALVVALDKAKRLFA